MGDLVVPGPVPGRILLGRLQPGTLESAFLALVRPDRATPALAAPRCRAVLVIGPARSGKTTSILVPAVSGWQGPVVATSIRSDVIAGSVRARQTSRWPPLVYNPSLQGDYGSNTWSPLAGIGGSNAWQTARRLASVLVTASGLAGNGSNSQMDFWNATAIDYVGPLLLAAAQDGPSMAPVMKWLQQGDLARESVTQRLRGFPDALRQAEAVWATGGKASSPSRSSIYLTARTALSAYDDPGAMTTCLGRGPAQTIDITPEAVLGPIGTATDPTSARGSSLYIVSPAEDLATFAPLFTALLTSIIDAAYHRSERGGGLPAPLLLALDEVANIVPIRTLPNIAATAAGNGIQLLTVFQDLGQADRIWGTDDARTLLSNHYARLILSGTVDRATLDWIHALLPEIDVSRTVRNPDGWFGRRLSERRTERRRIIDASDIREMPIGTALLLAGRYPAARVTLREGTTI
jgi:type IV secretion system protein VirD4